MLLSSRVRAANLVFTPLCSCAEKLAVCSGCKYNLYSLYPSSPAVLYQGDCSSTEFGLRFVTARAVGVASRPARPKTYQMAPAWTRLIAPKSRVCLVRLTP